MPGKESNWSVIIQIPEVANPVRPSPQWRGKNERITTVSNWSSCVLREQERLAAEVHAYYENKNTTYWRAHRSRYWGWSKIFSLVTPAHAIWAREWIYWVIWSFNLNTFWITMCSYIKHLPLEALPPGRGAHGKHTLVKSTAKQTYKTA